MREGDARIYIETIKNSIPLWEGEDINSALWEDINSVCSSTTFWQWFYETPTSWSGWRAFLSGNSSGGLWARARLLNLKLLCTVLWAKLQYCQRDSCRIKMYRGSRGIEMLQKVNSFIIVFLDAWFYLHTYGVLSPPTTNTNHKRKILIQCVGIRLLLIIIYNYKLPTVICSSYTQRNPTSPTIAAHQQPSSNPPSYFQNPSLSPVPTFPQP